MILTQFISIRRDLLALLDATQAAAPIGEISAAVASVKGYADRTKASAASQSSPGSEGEDDFAAEHFLLVVDSLHSWADAIGDGEEYDRLNVGLSELRLLAKCLNCPVLAIAERNRASKNSSSQSAGAGTRKIEYGAETVIALDTDDDAKESPDGLKEVKLTIGKNRNGKTGKTTLLFHGGMMKFTESPV